MLSAAFDFLGEMIEQSYQIYINKISKGSNGIKEKWNMEDCSMKGSYNS